MGKKLRQVTDSVHGTIYLSDLESQLISTPFFYRLHDVYQSSTVYMTFPSNRTKRYEHSLGTMELASRMFFSAVANADICDRNGLLSQLYDHVCLIANKVSTDDILGVKYCQKSDEIIAQNISDHFKTSQRLDECIMQTVKDGVINDLALDHFMLCFFDLIDMQNSTKYLFIYQCILEAIRIAALFHDVGHPPYSHIIEEVLNDIYSSCLSDKDKPNNQFNDLKTQELVKALQPFIELNKSKIEHNSRNGNPLILVKDNRMKDTEDNTPLHEQVGVKMLQLATENIFNSLMTHIQTFRDFSCTNNDEKSKDRAGMTLYYICVIEFTFGILLEKNILFQSIHRIIDGPFDSDRLDYIVRDSLNSGINWGKVPYKRILDSAVLMRPFAEKVDFFTVAFPDKISDDIDEVLLTRYKIFSRINFHHRSVKTATLLQNAVKELAYDYLQTNNPHAAICEEISGLWTALGATLGSQALKVVQWNDSWLITILYSALVTLSDANRFEDFVSNHKKDSVKLLSIKHLLEEVLLNHKYYYSLFKRKADMINLINNIYKKASIKSLVNKLKIKEKKKLDNNINIDKEKYDEATESLRRFNLLDQALEKGDFDLLNKIFPTFQPLIDIISLVLKNEKKSKRIRNYQLLENNGRNKLGLPSKDNISKKIYLYNNKRQITAYNSKGTLEPQLNALYSTCLNFHVYIEIFENDQSPESTLDKVYNNIVNAMGKELKNAFLELFPSEKKEKTQSKLLHLANI